MMFKNLMLLQKRNGMNVPGFTEVFIIICIIVEITLIALLGRNLYLGKNHVNKRSVRNTGTTDATTETTSPFHTPTTIPELQTTRNPEWMPREVTILHPVVLDKDQIKVALGCAITSKGTGRLANEYEIQRNMPFFHTLLPSFCATASNGYKYHFYLAYDDTDSFFISPANQKKFRQIFMKMMQKDCEEPQRMFLHLVRCYHHGKPAWAQNDAMMQAYLDNVDYFYRINDDTSMTSSNWTEQFIQRLREAHPSNVGVVGPNHEGGNFLILTYDFVHKTHIDIFGYYYPREFTDWYADGWMTKVYTPNHTSKVLNAHLTHDLVASRYTENITKEPTQWIMVRKGKQEVNSYIKYSTKNSARRKGNLVIAVSLKSDNASLVYGMLRNINLARKYFPQWTLRIYTNRTDATSDRAIEKAKSLGGEIHYVNKTIAQTIPPSMWHYLVVDDLKVDRFIIREADTRLTFRDQIVVNQFIRSKEVFHCVRDHPSHAKIPIVDGTWGANARKLRKLLRSSMFDHMLKYLMKIENGSGDRFKFTYDVLKVQQQSKVPPKYVADTLEEKFLAEVIWPLVVDHIYCHDSVSCHSWPRSHPFPVQRFDNEFIGKHYGSFGKSLNRNIDFQDMKCVIKNPYNYTRT